MKRPCLAFLAVGWLATGCSGDDSRPVAARDTLTDRQRQEAIGRSGLPGATGITGALKASDSATARNQRLDSIGQP